MIEIDQVRNHQKAANTKIYLLKLDELITLDKLADKISNGETDYLNALVSRIRATMKSQRLPDHVEHAKELQGKCVILREKLVRREFPQQNILHDAFDELDVYSGVGLFPQLH